MCFNERVTTIECYAPNSQLSLHVHAGGDEFIVLDGVFEGARISMDAQDDAEIFVLVG